MLGTPTMLKRHNLGYGHSHDFRGRGGGAERSARGGSGWPGQGDPRFPRRRRLQLHRSVRRYGGRAVRYPRGARRTSPWKKSPRHFKVEDYVPKLEGLPDDLPWETFVKQYGQPGSESFQRQRVDLFDRILALPPYRCREGQEVGI